MIVLNEPTALLELLFAVEVYYSSRLEYPKIDIPWRLQADLHYRLLAAKLWIA